MIEFKKQLEQKIIDMQRVVETYLPEPSGYHKTVTEAMNYAVKAGGKRLRPLLLWEVYQMYGGNKPNIAEPFMAALEMIHTYSLIHDDLPAMDNDEYRRGKKTVHIVFGEAMAILAGDGLLNYAYETACKAFQEEDNLRQVALAMKILAQKPGLYGMLGGQAIDVEAEQTFSVLDQEKLNYIYSLKTGALWEAAMMIGAVLAGADQSQVELMEQAGHNMGLAFQIRDDILDVAGDFKTLGKPIHSDEKNHKVTYASLMGLEKAEEMTAYYTGKAIEYLEKSGTQNEFLKNLIQWMILRKQ